MVNRSNIDIPVQVNFQSASFLYRYCLKLFNKKNFFGPFYTFMSVVLNHKLCNWLWTLPFCGFFHHQRNTTGRIDMHCKRLLWLFWQNGKWTSLIFALITWAAAIHSMHPNAVEHRTRKMKLHAVKQPFSWAHFDIMSCLFIILQFIVVWFCSYIPTHMEHSRPALLDSLYFHFLWCSLICMWL